MSNDVITINFIGPRLHPQPVHILRQLEAALEPAGGAQLEAARGQPAAGQDDAAGAHARQAPHRHEQDEAGRPQEGTRR